MSRVLPASLLSLVKEDGDSGPYLRTAEVLPVYEDLRHTLRGETTVRSPFPSAFP